MTLSENMINRIRTGLSGTWLLIFVLALVKLLVHFLTNTNYELQRDAFLYLAMADHPDFGYVSVPPSIALVGGLMRAIFGDSVFAVRLAPALTGAASVIMIGMGVRELGGRSWAIAIGCLAFITSPAFLRSNTLFQPVTFNQFYWLLSSYFIIRLLNTKNLRYWYIIFLIWGLAFLNKYSIVFFSFSIVAAFLLTTDRKLLFNKFFFRGMAIAALIALPNLIWQYSHNWPVLHHMLDLQASQLVHVRITDFLAMQILMNFPQILVWTAGLLFILFTAAGRTWRVFGYTYLIMIVLFILLRGKAYYTLGIYPVLFAAGAYAIEYYSTGRMKFLKYFPVPLMIILLMPALPISLPVLQPEAMVRYGQGMRNYGLEGALRWEDGRIHPLPQDYADMVAWEELSDIVIRTYQSLSPVEQESTVIYAENYGEAASIKYYGRRYNLPEPVSFDESFIFWAPDSITLTTLIYVNDDTTDIAFFFREIEPVGRITNPYARETGLPVYLCRGPKNNFEQFYRDKVHDLKSIYR